MALLGYNGLISKLIPIMGFTTLKTSFINTHMVVCQVTKEADMPHWYIDKKRDKKQFLHMHNSIFLFNWNKFYSGVKINIIFSRKIAAKVTKGQILDGSISNSIETRPDHLGHPGHILSGSSGSDPVYRLSGFDPDWIMSETKLLV